MNKTIIIAAFAVTLLAASGFAHADRYGGHHGPPRHAALHARQHGLYLPRHGFQHSRRYGYRGHHHHDYRHGLRIAAGAVVLGSLIHAINHDRHERVVYRTRQPVRRDFGNYVLDSDGACYEVSVNDRGQEVWTWMDSSYCY